MASNAQINLRELFTQHNDAISVSVLEGVNRAINSFIDREIADLTELHIINHHSDINNEISS
jgi:hypothetical protein